MIIYSYLSTIEIIESMGIFLPTAMVKNISFVLKVVLLL